MILNDIPLSVTVLFVLTVITSLGFFYYSTGFNKISISVLFFWSGLQSLISLNGFYTETTSIPPRFVFLIGPPVLLMIALFATQKGRSFIDSIDPGIITLFSIVRIPVEIVLLLLFLNGKIPQIMTFEGRNFDIFSGITAPIVFWLGYRKNTLPKSAMILWNIVCLMLVLNVVIHGILSAPFPFQQFGFNQPNVGVLHFPFTLLPGLIVPMVIFAHLVCLRKLMKSK